jgi:(5-formylfuran-3-yl)methyl phosphate synthase
MVDRGRGAQRAGVGVTRLLVSVRSVAEALVAAQGDADLIDLKEPNGGALGGLSVDTIGVVIAALRERRIALPVSATIGDLPMHALATILDRVEAVASCGVDYVKVGIERAPMASAVLDALAASGRSIVPVFIADLGLDDQLVEHAASLGFPGLMVDTADKRSGSLFDLLSSDDLHRFVARARAAGALAGVAGALRLDHVPAIQRVAPDFAGFRSAVCAGDRRAALDPQRLQQLAARMRGQAVSAAASV